MKSRTSKLLIILKYRLHKIITITSNTYVYLLNLIIRTSELEWMHMVSHKSGYQQRVSR